MGDDLRRLIDLIKGYHYRYEPELRNTAMRDPATVELLIGALDHKDGSVRADAARALQEIGDRRAVEPLIRTLRDKDPHVRTFAARSLAVLKDPRAVEPLIEALRDTVHNVRSAACDALGRIGDARRVEPLIGALSDREPEVRSTAAWALGWEGNEGAVAPLIQALRDSEDNVRSAAAKALANIGDPRAVGPLVTMAELPDSSWDANKALKELETVTREEVARLAKWLRGDPPISDEERMQAARTLGQMKVGSARDELIKALQGGTDGGLRSAAAWGLGETGNRLFAVQPLIEALSDTPAAIGAAHSLGMIGDPLAVKPLITMSKHNDTEMRKAAVKALRQFEDSRIPPALTDAIKDTNPDVRSAAIEGLKAYRARLSVAVEAQRVPRQGQYHPLPVVITNEGNSQANDVALAVQGPWDGTSLPVGDLAPGASRACSMSLCPKASGATVPIGLLISWIELCGDTKAVAFQMELAVAPPVDPEPSLIQAGGDVIMSGGAKAQVQDGVAVARGATPEPFRFCPYCHQSFSLPKTPKFCPYCGETLGASTET